MSPQTILFTTDRPALYDLSEIYNSITNPNGTIIPRPDSLVLDPVNNGLLQRVVSVDSVTHNSILGPVYTSLLAPATPDLNKTDTSIVSIIDYGNSRFYLLYDEAETPTKLNIDKKVVILGDDAVDYDITKWNDLTKTYVPISLYYDTDGTYRGTKSPLTPVAAASNVKIPTNCNTTFSLKDDEIYFLNVYDYSGSQCGSFKLFAKRGIINNDLSDNLLIEDFTLESTQMDNDGFYLFPEQDPSTLVITPRAIYNDGSSRMVVIDESICYLYGLEGFQASYPGQSVDLLVKYFLAPTQQAVGPTVHSSGSSKYLTKIVKLNVKDPGTNEYSVKIMTVPTYLPTTNRWTLSFFLYTLGDNVVRNITPDVTVTPVFDGLRMGIQQSLVLSLHIRDIFPEAASDFVYTQPLLIKVAPYAYYERYVISDTVGDTYGVYGVDSPILPRPILHYDSVAGVYFIPTSIFSNEALVLEAFYYKTRPLYDTSWLSAPVTPTHFTIRNAVNGIVLLSAPIPLSGYQQGFAITNVTQQNQLLGTNCIVEFLAFANGVYTVLYGAPVDVVSGTYTA